jgi:hypothetical protein
MIATTIKTTCITPPTSRLTLGARTLRRSPVSRYPHPYLEMSDPNKGRKVGPGARVPSKCLIGRKTATAGRSKRERSIDSGHG